jgi:acyl carrier protein
LPRPDGESISRTSEWVPARNPIEQKLVAIWSSILRVRKVGIFDSFFELGGHSLLATRLISRVREEFEVDVPLTHIFQYPRLAEFAVAVEAIIVEQVESMSEAEIEGLIGPGG